jgi:serine/threonine-protein kinase
MVAHRYELVEIAGEGGMATVWKGVMRGAAGWERPVAIKKMKPEFRALKNYIDMFVEEARVGSDIHHPNIVQVYDFCQDRHKNYYLVMEWIEGIDLHSYIYSYKRLGERAPWALVVAIGIGALRGLSAAHSRRRYDGTLSPVIHRDVSPANILLGINGTVKVTDFGLARARDRIFSLTAPGMVKGKLSYLSPEIAAGDDATPASDIFSMANTLWESLAGERLYPGNDDVEVFKQIRTGKIRSIAELRPDIPKQLVELLRSALSVDPARRPQTASDMANQLSSILRTVPNVDMQARLAESVHWVRTQSPRRSRPLTTPELVEPSLSFVIDVDLEDS